MSAYQVGDVVRWKMSMVANGDALRARFTVTETGLTSSVVNMPGEQVRVRTQDGSETRLWAEDIELACRAVG